MAAELGPGSILSFPPSGAKVTEALASGLPLSVIRPETGAVLDDPQPANRQQASGRSNRIARRGVMECLGERAGLGRSPRWGSRCLIGVGGLAARDRAHRREHTIDINARADRADRSVAQDEVDAVAAVQRAPPALAHVTPAQAADPLALVEVREEGTGLPDGDRRLVVGGVRVRPEG